MPTASFVADHTSGTSASGTAVTVTLASDVAAGNLLAVWVGMDNLTATTPTVSSLDKPGGEGATWARVAQHDSSTATAAGGVRGELWVIQTTVAWASGTVITATLSASPPKSCATCREFIRASASLRGTAGTNTSATGVPSAATSGTALVAGDLVLGGATWETSTTPTGDTDTTNGSWSAVLVGSATGGATAVQVRTIQQYKIVTATGVQTFNPPAPNSTDSGAAVVGLQSAAANITGTAAGDYTFTGTAAGTVKTPTSRANTFEGGTNGVAIDASNSGGTSGDPVGIGGDAPTYTTTTPIKGSVSGLATAGVSGSSFVYYDLPAGYGTTDSYLRAYFEAPNPIPSGTFWLMESKRGDNGGNACQARMTAAGAFAVTDTNDTAQGTTTTTVSAGQKFRLAMHHFANGASGQIELRLFTGAKLHSPANDPTETLGPFTCDAGPSVGRQRFGLAFATAAVSVKFDDIAISNTDWPGPTAVPTVTGAASGDYSFTGAAAGTIVGATFGAAVGDFAFDAEAFGAVTFNVNGAALGAYSFSGTVGGRRTSNWSATSSATTQGGVGAVSGTAQGDYAFTGIAAGLRTVAGQAAGDYAFTGAAAGLRTVAGQAIGGYAFTGAAAGLPNVPGAALGAYSFTGTAAGTVQGVGGGAALGAYSFTGTAAGVPTIPGQAAASFGFAGLAVGTPTKTGQALGGYSFTATALGVVAGQAFGTAAGGYSFTGLAAGVPVVPGLAAAGFSFTGTAAGQPIAPVLGQAAGAYSFTGLAAGRPIVVAQAGGSFAFAGTALGARVLFGVAQGFYAFAAAAAGAGTSTPPPRWVEGATTASGITEGVLVAAGVVEGSASL